MLNNFTFRSYSSLGAFITRRSADHQPRPLSSVQGNGVLKPLIASEIFEKTRTTLEQKRTNATRSYSIANCGQGCLDSPQPRVARCPEG